MAAALYGRACARLRRHFKFGSPQLSIFLKTDMFLVWVALKREMSNFFNLVFWSVWTSGKRLENVWKTLARLTALVH